MFTRNHTKQVSIVLILLTASISVLGLQITGLGPVHRTYATGTEPVLLGLDCGLGTAQAAPDPITGVPSADGSLDANCNWIGDADGDTVLDPLVSDDLSTFPGTGGGFTVDIRVTGLTTALAGLDVSLSYDTRYLNGVLIDQSGLIFGGTGQTCFEQNTCSVFTLVKSIDPSAGIIRVAQVLLGTKTGPGSEDGLVDETLFRVRFDVVGVGTSPLDIFDDVLPTPDALPHKTSDGSFESVSFYDPLLTLGWDVSWTFSPNPEVPGSPLTFTATAACPGCGALSYSWDTNGNGAADAGEPTGNPATITAPPPITHRVALTVSDGTNTVMAVRRLPLAVAVQGPSTIAINTAGTWNGFWLGGIPTYSGAWRFCPGPGITANAVCARPAPPVAATSGQTSTQTLSSATPPGAYHFAGIYTNTLRITDATGINAPWIGPSVSVTHIFLVEVTGTPQAYTVTLTSSAAKANTGEPVTFTATVAYDPTYPSTFKSTAFEYRFDFGDGSTTTMSGGLSVTATKTYNIGGTFDARVTAQETSLIAVSKIQERSNIVTQQVNVPVAGPVIDNVTFDPAAPTAGKPVTFTATITGGTAPITVNWMFGDGETGTGNPVTHSYAVKGSYTVTATATDAESRTSPAFTLTVVVAPQALAISISTSASPSAGKPVDFTATISGGTAPYSVTWDFGDGGTGTGATTSHTYAVKGSYVVTASVTDMNAATASATATVVVAPQPLAADFTSTASPTAGKPVSFMATASGGTGPYTFSWNFGDTSTGTGQNIDHSYAVKGTYTVTLTVTDANTQSVIVTHSVVVAPQPLQASITASSPATAGKPVTFTATISGGTGPYSVSWSFGDGNTGTGVSVDHSYAVKGTYTVTATVTDMNSASTTATTTVIVAAQPLVITANCSDGTAGKPISCSASATGGTTPYTFEWDVGADGTIDGTGADFTTSFPVKGQYSIKAIVTDFNSASAQTTLTVTITAQPLSVSFTFTPEAPTAGKHVMFTATATGGTGPYTFNWDLGDGTTATGSSVTHSYTVKGTYTVHVTVTDSNSATAMTMMNIVVSPQALAADFSWPTPVVAGTPVTFTATASGGTSPYTFQWDVGKDGTIDGTGASFTHTFTTSGVISVDLIASDANSASTRVNKVVDVQAPGLAADFSFDPAAPTAGKPVTFTASATGGTEPLAFSWNFGDQSSTTGNPVTHTYAVKGSYTVILTVTDAESRIAQVTKVVTVSGQPLVITASCSNGTAGKPIECSASATGGTTPYTFTWDVNKDGTIDGTGPSFTTSFAVKGTYSIDAIVTDANGDTVRVNLTVVISAQPLAVDFVFDPTAPTTGKPVTFTATATGGTMPYTYEWDFGDLSGDIGNPVTHSYAVKGSYTVVLMVTDLNGATAQASHLVVVAPQQLAVSITINDSTGNNNGLFELNEVLHFEATASGGTSGYAFQWSFGDGASDTANPTTHAYSTEGLEVVTVTVTDANNAQAGATVEITIIRPKTAPVAVLDIYDDAIAADRKISGQILFVTEPVIFDASRSADTNIPPQPLSYAWDFDGDGIVDATTATATFTYTTPGGFTVTLTVMNDHGLSDTESTNVTVYLEPTLTRGKMSWKHHMTSGNIQNFIAKARNLAAISLNVRLQVNIFDADTGEFVAMVSSPEVPMAPGELRLDITASWQTPVVTNTTKYSHTGTLLYNVMDPATGNLVTGTDLSKSGSFATVP